MLCIRLSRLWEQHGFACAADEPASPHRFTKKQSGQTAEFVTGLTLGGACDIYELESNQWVLEVRPSAFSGGKFWTD